MLVPTTKAEIGMATNVVRDNAELARNFFHPHEYDDEASWVSV